MHVWYKFNSIRFIHYGTNKNSKNIHVSYDVTPEERENLREEKEEKKKEKGKGKEKCR